MITDGASPTSFPPLVVSSDPAGFKKAMIPALVVGPIAVVVFAFIAVCIAALSASSGNVSTGIMTALPILISVAWITYLSVNVAKAAGTRLAGGDLVTLDSAGFHANVVPHGTVSIPWAAVTSVQLRKRGRHTIISFRAVPDLKPTSPGVTTTLPPQYFRMLVKKGFRLGSAGIDVPTQTIADAAAAFTSGRLSAH